MNPPAATICLACGAELGAELQLAGSTRCQDCREAQAELRRDLLELQRRPSARGPAPAG